MVKKHRILLIDDTPEIAELLTYGLRDRGFEVVSTSFTEAITQLVVDERADALVLDCSVYQMSESLFDMVRGDPSLAELPIVVISDTPEKADRSLRAREADHVLLIPKPFSASHVARALDQLLPVSSGQPAAGEAGSELPEKPAAGSESACDPTR